MNPGVRPSRTFGATEPVSGLALLVEAGVARWAVFAVRHGDWGPFLTTGEAATLATRRNERSGSRELSQLNQQSRLKGSTVTGAAHA
jgi:hypothetical protein